MKENIKGFFVTGTDTDIGKTLIASALLILLKQKYFKTVALKPIASGCIMTSKGLRSPDAYLLQKYMTEKLAYSEINPFAFLEPISPHIAAKIADQVLSVKIIMDACQDILKKQIDYLVIEGIGGWLVPLNAHETTADLAKAFGYPIILVVGMRVGCLNHTLLTIESMRKKSITLAGWVANSMQSEMPYLTDHIETLQRSIPAPLLGIVPYLTHVEPFNPSLAVPYLKQMYHLISF